MASVSPQLSLGSFNCVRAWGASFVDIRKSYYKVCTEITIFVLRL